jgi:hypothetical protein
VTLGLPRLREIIMTASEKIKTPVMEMPLLPDKSEKHAEECAAKLNRYMILILFTLDRSCLVPFSRLNSVKIADFLTDISVRDDIDGKLKNRYRCARFLSTPPPHDSMIACRLYIVRFEFVDMASEQVKKAKLNFKHFANWYPTQPSSRLAPDAVFAC